MTKPIDIAATLSRLQHENKKGEKVSTSVYISKEVIEELKNLLPPEITFSALVEDLLVQVLDAYKIQK